MLFLSFHVFEVLDKLGMPNWEDDFDSSHCLGAFAFFFFFFIKKIFFYSTDFSGVSVTEPN